MGGAPAAQRRCADASGVDAFMDAGKEKNIEKKLIFTTLSEQNEIPFPRLSVGLSRAIYYRVTLYTSRCMYNAIAKIILYYIQSHVLL